jgi:hypothetical protein
MRNWELILSLSNSDLELTLSLFNGDLESYFYHLTNVDGNFTMIKYHDG